jgi:hypothetical protein
MVKEIPWKKKITPLAKKLTSFTETESFLQCSKKSAYPKPDESTPLMCTTFSQESLWCYPIYA